MMGALDRSDAVDLHEAKAFDQSDKVFSRRRTSEAVPVEEQPSGVPIGEVV